MSRWWALTWFTMGGCVHSAQLQQDFQDRIDATLVTLPPLDARWAADASAWIADDVVRGTMDAAVHDLVMTRTFSLAGMSATPRLSVVGLQVGPAADPCADCLGVVARLGGDVGFTVFGATRQIGVLATVSLDASVDVAPDGDALALIAHPLRVDDVRVAWDGAPAWAISALPLPMLTTWISERALTLFPPISVARFGGGALPVRDVRVSALPGGLRVEARTAAPQTLAVGPVAQPDHGWSVRVPVDTVLQLARRQLFQQGPGDHDVWVDPVGLKLGEGTFSLRMRLWRVVGAPWWREIEVHGSLAVHRSKIVLRAEDAVELGASSGAGFADPLVALARGQVLDAIADAASLTVPTSQSAALGSTPATWRIHELSIDANDLVLSGETTFGDTGTDGSDQPEDAGQRSP